MSYIRWKPGILILLALSLSVYVFLIYPSRRGDSGTPFVRPPSSTADIVIHDLSLVQTAGGRVEWRMGAEAAEWFEGEHRMEIKSPRVEVISANGLGVRFEGDEGAIDTETRDFSVRNRQDDLAVVFSNGYTVMTSGIEWSDRDRTLGSRSPVSITGPRVVVRGESLRVDTVNQEVSIRGNVHGTLLNPS